MFAPTQNLSLKAHSSYDFDSVAPATLVHGNLSASLLVSSTMPRVAISTIKIENGKLWTLSLHPLR